MTAGKFTTFVDYNETFSNDHLSFKNTFGSSTTDTWEAYTVWPKVFDMIDDFWIKTKGHVS